MTAAGQAPVAFLTGVTGGWGRAVLDRFLAASEWLSVPAIICLTKLDLGASAELLAEVDRAHAAFGERTLDPEIAREDAAGRDRERGHLRAFSMTAATRRAADG